jgi:hypothetical protein
MIHSWTLCARIGRFFTPRHRHHQACPRSNGWERLLPGAVAQAWQHDPETMGGLLATLLAQHMAGRTHCMDETLDELQLMISMELQALAGYPD